MRREIEKAFATIRNTTDADGNKLYQHLIAEKILVINPAEDAAKALFRELAKSKLRLHESETSRAMEDVFYMSVPNAACEGIRLTQDGRDLEYAYKYGRSTGHHLREDTTCPFPVSGSPSGGLAKFGRTALAACLETDSFDTGQIRCRPRRVRLDFSSHGNDRNLASVYKGCPAFAKGL
ncbi:MAG: hypothetical protein U0905_19035 [Pirellulales bacterium]